MLNIHHCPCPLTFVLRLRLTWTPSWTPPSPTPPGAFAKSGQRPERVKSALGHSLIFWGVLSPSCSPPLPIVPRSLSIPLLISLTFFLRAIPIRYPPLSSHSSIMHAHSQFITPSPAPPPTLLHRVERALASTLESLGRCCRRSRPSTLCAHELVPVLEVPLHSGQLHLGHLALPILLGSSVMGSGARSRNCVMDGVP